MLRLGVTQLATKGRQEQINRRSFATSSRWFGMEEDDEVDWYRVLGVEPDSDVQKIKQAYRMRCKECHPDVNQSPHASDTFKRVRTAYEVLSNPAKRSAFDARFNYRHATGLKGTHEARKPFRSDHRYFGGRFFNAAEVYLSKNLRWAIVGLLPIWAILYVGMSTLFSDNPERFDAKPPVGERRVRAGYCEKNWGMARAYMAKSVKIRTSQAT
mmetsp:Transcript_16016/g.30979  ORF Transcript_16016/g.30979 Transcript_16016/m.30979 type:complete len:213 (+) Transcript_16016:81-719(+)